MKTFQRIISIIALTIGFGSIAQTSHFIYVSDAGNFNIPTSKV